MNRFFVIPAIFAFGLLAGCGNRAKGNSASQSKGSSASQEKSSHASQPLLRAHFVGMNRIVELTNAGKLKDIWTLPTSQQLRKQAVEKAALAPFELWKKLLPAGASDQPQLIRPLLDDLLTSESYIELN